MSWATSVVRANPQRRRFGRPSTATWRRQTAQYRYDPPLRHIIADHLLTHRTPCRDLSAEDDKQQARERDLGTLRQRAAKLGLTLMEASA